jgi:hypothetical protein
MDPATCAEAFVEALRRMACPDQARLTLMRFAGPVLLVLSGQDYTAREFAEYVGTHAAWRGALSRPNVQRNDMAQADHTFSDTAQRTALEATTAAWLATVR